MIKLFSFLNCKIYFKFISFSCWIPSKFLTLITSSINDFIFLVCRTFKVHHSIQSIEREKWDVENFLRFMHVYMLWPAHHITPKHKFPFFSIRKYHPPSISKHVFHHESCLPNVTASFRRSYRTWYLHQTRDLWT